MEADGDGIGGDAEHRGDLLIPQFLPRDEAQDLLVGGRQRRQRGECGSVLALPGMHRGRDVVDAEKRRESLPAAEASAMVGEDPPRDGIEPRKRLVGRDGADLAPGDGEGLGGHVLGISDSLGPPHRISEDVPLVRAEDGVEACEGEVLGGGSHRPRTTGAPAWFPAEVWESPDLGAGGRCVARVPPSSRVGRPPGA